MSSSLLGRPRHINRATAGIQDNRAAADRDARVYRSTSQERKIMSQRAYERSILAHECIRLEAPVLQFALPSHKSQTLKEVRLLSLVTKQNQYVIPRTTTNSSQINSESILKPCPLSHCQPGQSHVKSPPPTLANLTLPELTYSPSGSELPMTQI